MVCDSVLYEFLFASWHGLRKWRKFISQTTKKLDKERLHRMDETSMDISTVLMWLFKEIWGSVRDRETFKSVEYDRLALLYRKRISKRALSKRLFVKFKLLKGRVIPQMMSSFSKALCTYLVETFAAVDGRITLEIHEIHDCTTRWYCSSLACL